MTGDIWLGAGDVGAMTMAQGDARYMMKNSGQAMILLGGKQDFSERRGNERVYGGVVTAWADFGGSSYHVYWRTLNYWNGSSWVLTAVS